MSNTGNVNMTPGASELWAAGFRALVPITPPDGTPSPEGAYRKRERDMGKGPGIVNARGEWIGCPWLSPEFVATPESVAAWSDMGAGFGLRVGVPDELGYSLVAVDIDILDPALSARAVTLARELLGPAPIRTGRAPKRLMLYRANEPLDNAKVTLDDGVTAAPSVAQVDVMVRSKQFVASGIHPGTRKPYTWDGFTIAGALTAITHESLQAFVSACRDAFPAAEVVDERPADRARIDQASLRGDPERVRAVMRDLPNGAAFDGYEAYRNVGIALKASLPDEPDEAEALWIDWCDRWENGRGTLGEAQRHWRSFHPPFALGATYLYALAAEHVEGATMAGLMFDELPEPTPAERAVAEARQAEAAARKAIRWVNAGAAWRGALPPPRRMIVEGFLPHGETALLYGDGGVGKTLLAQQLGTVLASGCGEFLGLRCESEQRVMMFLCEDSEDELHRRQADIMRSLGLGWDDIGDRLMIASRKFLDNTLAAADRNTGRLAPSELYGAFRDDVAAFKPGVVFVDTMADTFAGNEIDRQQVRAFIQSGLGGLIKAGAGCVVGLAHPSRAGMSSGTGDSGSTGWHNSVRARYYLQRVEGDSSMRVLENKKSNYGASGDRFMLQYRDGAFGLVNAVVGDKAALANPETFPDATATNEAAVLDAVRWAMTGGINGKPLVMSDSPSSQNYSVKVLRRNPDAGVNTLSPGEVEAALRGLIARKDVTWEVVGRDAARREQRGLVARRGATVEVNPPPPTPNGFDDLSADESLPDIFA